jgi:hypothetical protein
MTLTIFKKFKLSKASQDIEEIIELTRVLKVHWLTDNKGGRRFDIQVGIESSELAFTSPVSQDSKLSKKKKSRRTVSQLYTPTKDIQVLANSSSTASKWVKALSNCVSIGRKSKVSHRGSQISPLPSATLGVNYSRKTSLPMALSSPLKDNPLKIDEEKEELAMTIPIKPLKSTSRMSTIGN